MTPANANMNNRTIEGCLLGTAVGDALGLPRENLSRRRALRLHGGAPLKMGLIAGRGYCSDDTEHSAIIARAIIASAGNETEFARSVARQLRAWLLTAPAGIGKATLKACLKLCFGVSPAKSGVRSAGNGPSMRAAIIGFSARSIGELVTLNTISSRITHTDPRAIQGAELVARTAYYLGESPDISASELLEQATAIELDSDLKRHMMAAIQALQEGLTPEQFADSQEWQKGVSGFVNHTVPAALYCWAAHRGDFRRAVESAILLGGDTDSVAGITGGIAGGEMGADNIPTDWLDHLAEWPRNIVWMRRLAQQLTDVIRDNQPQQPMPMHWAKTFVRNLLFGATVIVLALRRLLPPY
jgi:ADP-ribosyl-[dinitrogen reductase] hydrolase